MASIFTYDPNPPRVSSPWSIPSHTPPIAVDNVRHVASGVRELGGLSVASLARLEDLGIAYLEAEPGLGPVEYKLHLLLRPRQSFVFISTGGPGTDPHLPRTSLTRPRPPLLAVRDITVALYSGGGAGGGAGGSSGLSAGSPLSAISPSPKSRQNRLQHLTTQLLWRLQQSSPYHASSAADLVIPNLPDVSEAQFGAPSRPGKLLPGLEESQGAMYEIGVNDDGALIGLTRDEMDESLLNLRAMAASLGCVVSILRAVVVGTCCPAPPPTGSASAPSQTPLAGKLREIQESALAVEDLFVVEALVLPDTAVHPNGRLVTTPLRIPPSKLRPDRCQPEKQAQETEQLRVSLTGSTTSGKSSLLGTLLASTLDNARGKSRLNLLKHRHEIASGVTSSVAHELLGYRQSEDTVVNYACGNVESWTDVHSRAEGGRLVLLTDTAGHPRYRRTIVRGLLAWKPHWTLCCIAAVYAKDSAVLAETRASTLGSRGGEAELSPAQALAVTHLELCLKLDLPLVVVITKYDLATRVGLRQILGSILDRVKAAGRVPHVLKPTAPADSDEELQTIPHHDMHEARTVLASMGSEPSRLVPIMLTSAVTGIGMTKLHALLRQLPIIPSPQLQDNGKEDCSADSEAAVTPSVLFDIDEVFVKQNQGANTGGGETAASSSTRAGRHSFVLSGLLQKGLISIGDELLLGPFSETLWTMDPRPPLDQRRAASYPVTHHEIAMRRDAELSNRHRRSSDDLGGEGGPGPPPPFKEDGNNEWYTVRVDSLRNLRLPVHTSFQGQAATAGISFVGRVLPASRPRKGMVLLRLPEHEGQQQLPCACRAFRATFDLAAYQVMEPGSLFNVYVASVRALAKVVTVGLLDLQSEMDDGGDYVFQLDGAPDPGDVGMGTLKAGPDDRSEHRQLEVVFQLVNSREYIQLGARVFVMPGQAADGAVGLDGYPGKVSEVLG